MNSILKTINSRKNLNWSLLCFDAGINLFFIYIIQKLYKAISMMIINHYQLNISTIIRPWLIWQIQPFSGNLFYGLTIVWSICLILQIWILYWGIVFFSKQSLNFKNFKVFCREIGEKWNLKLNLGLAITFWPLSSFLQMTDYFGNFRLNELYTHLLQGSIILRISILLGVFLYGLVAWWTVQRIGKTQKERNLPVKMLKQTVFMFLFYYMIAGMIALIVVTFHISGNFRFGLIVMRGVRWILGLLWLQKLNAVTGTFWINGENKFSRRWISQCTLLLVVSLLWLPNPKVALTSLQWIAHKGVDGNNEFGNSLSALKKTAGKQPDYVELDVQMTKDRKFVVFHDRNLKKLTGQNGEIRDYSLEELEHFTLKMGHRQERLVSFSHYQKTAQKYSQKLLIEIKIAPDQNKKELVEQFMDQYENVLKANDDLVQTTDSVVLQTIQRINPKQSVGLILPITFWGIPKGGANFYTIEKSTYDLATSKKIKNEHKKVYIWTINDPLNYLVSNLSAPDGVISDHFSELKKVMKSSQKKRVGYGMIWVYIASLNP